MKTKNYFKITILLLSLLLFTTGCTKQLKDSNGKVVKNEVTGQTLTQNILCRPESEETLKAYQETIETTKNKLDEQLSNNEITRKTYDKKMATLPNLEELPTCSDFKITSGGYEGIWTTIFVKPLAWVILQVGKLVKNYGIAVIMVTLLIRFIMYPATKKTAMQSELMKEIKPEMDRIEKKYRNRTDQESMMQKSQETLLLYKKYNISPFSGCIYAIFQIPLFFAFYEALNRLPAIFEENLLGFQLGTNPGTGILNGQFQYLITVILVILATYFSMKLNKTASLDNEQAKSMETMMNIMIVMICISSLTISTGIALYWITNNAFTIIQNLLVKRRKEKNA